MNCFFIVKNRVLNKISLLLLMCVIGTLLIYNNYDADSSDNSVYSRQFENCDDNLQKHRFIVNNFYEKRKSWKTSNVGSILFKNVNTEVFQHVSRENKSYVVLIWKYYDWLKARHINSFNKSARNPDPLLGCSVSNCEFVGQDSYLKTADAVVVHMQKGAIPNVKDRNLKQRWIFLSDESPHNTYSLSSKRKSLLYKNFSNVFNWTMTYRSDSDVPVPYGRTVALDAPIIQDMDYESQIIPQLIPFWKDKQMEVLATVLMSNCGVKHRNRFLNNLQKHISVDIYGKCSNGYKETCPGHFRADCNTISIYIFYLVLENSLCRQYMTEKLFYHGYAKGAIPVIMGPPLDDCVKLLPPNSFLHVDNYKSVKDLADHMVAIAESVSGILEYHKWRNNFEVLNEHGFFGDKSYHWCRVCEAMNYNDGEVSIYDEDSLSLFFDENITCTKVI